MLLLTFGFTQDINKMHMGKSSGLTFEMQPSTRDNLTKCIKYENVKRITKRDLQEIQTNLVTKRALHDVPLSTSMSNHP